MKKLENKSGSNLTQNFLVSYKGLKDIYTIYPLTPYRLYITDDVKSKFDFW